MKEIVEYTEYSKEEGLALDVEKGALIGSFVENDEFIISVNKQGLLTLAKLMIAMAQDNVPYGCHMHLAEWNALVKDSTGFIIQKKGN